LSGVPLTAWTLRLVMAIGGKDGPRREGKTGGGPAPGCGTGPRHRRSPRAGCRGRETERNSRGAGPAESVHQPHRRGYHDRRKAHAARHGAAHHQPGAGYVMTVQASMPTLCQQLKKLPWAAIPATRPGAQTTAAGPAAPSRPCWHRPGPSPTPQPRSRNWAALSPGRAKRPSRWPASSPATAAPILLPGRLGPQPPGQRTSFTGPGRHLP
jgi:hypothetical protein